jgi:hypothetical protein
MASHAFADNPEIRFLIISVRVTRKPLVIGNKGLRFISNI